MNQTCPCMSGFFDNGLEICEKCSYKCTTCSGNVNSCLICNVGINNFRSSTAPACSCIEGYFDDGVQVKCKKCSPQCKTCENDANNCLTCSSNDRILSKQCDCKDGFYNSPDNVCLPCQINCLTCKTTKSSCLTCKPDRKGESCSC